jgi:hypothetical protein
MKRVRLLLLSTLPMLAMFVVGGVGATTASAAGCELRAVAGEWCFAVELNGTLELTTEAKFTSYKDPGTTSGLELEGLGTVECEKAHDEGTFLNGGAPQIDGLTVEFSGNCKYTENNTGCTFKEPITTTPILGEFSLNAATLLPQVMFTSETGTFFAYVQATGSSCEKATKAVIDGKQKCISTTIEEDLLSHLLLCLKSESELKNGTKTASFEVDISAFLLNFGEDKWSFQFERT